MIKYNGRDKLYEAEDSASRPINSDINEEFSFRSDRVMSQMENEIKAEGIPENIISLLRKICYYVGKVGLSLKDTCILLGIPENRIIALRERSKLVDRLINTAEVHYKKELLKTISSRARNGDDKLAQWILQTRFASEFGPSKKQAASDEAEKNDVIAEAIKLIQSNGDNKPLVDKDAGSKPVGTNIKGANEEELNSLQSSIDEILRGTAYEK